MRDLAITNPDDYERVARLLAGAHNSGTVNQVAVKMAVANDIGMGIGEALKDLHVIQTADGVTLEVSANWAAAKIKSHDRYDFRVIKSDHTECTILFREIDKFKPDTVHEYPHTYSIEDARQQGVMQGKKGIKKNWRNFAPAMLFARCIMQGGRKYCADALRGVYARGEVTGEFHYNENGETSEPQEINITPDPEPDKQPSPPPAMSEEDKYRIETKNRVRKAEQGYDIATLSNVLEELKDNQRSPELVKYLEAKLAERTYRYDEQAIVFYALFVKQMESFWTDFNHLTNSEQSDAMAFICEQIQSRSAAGEIVVESLQTIDFMHGHVRSKMPALEGTLFDSSQLPAED